MPDQDGTGATDRKALFSPSPTPLSWLFGGTAYLTALPEDDNPHREWGHMMLLTSVSNIVAFTDRPNHKARNVSMSAVVDAFNSKTEESNPPNALITLVASTPAEMAVVPVMITGHMTPTKDEMRIDDAVVFWYRFLPGVVTPATTKKITACADCLVSIFLDSVHERQQRRIATEF